MTCLLNLYSLHKSYLHRALCLHRNWAFLCCICSFCVFSHTLSDLYFGTGDTKYRNIRPSPVSFLRGLWLCLTGAVQNRISYNRSLARRRGLTFPPLVFLHPNLRAEFWDYSVICLFLECSGHTKIHPRRCALSHSCALRCRKTRGGRGESLPAVFS